MSRFLQLATVTVEGDPAVRTVVFRGWHDDPEESNKSIGLLTTTDIRSQKVSELRHHPFAELCWYFTVRHTILHYELP